jgi:hypothetical protein
MEMDRERLRLTVEGSPLSALGDRVTAPDALAEGPVRFLLVSGELDDARWGLVGAFWLSIDGVRGGFLVAPPAIWQGSEMARSFRSATTRGWSPEEVYRYWQHQVGAAGTIMIDPQQHADTLFQVARRVGAL